MDELKDIAEVFTVTSGTEETKIDPFDFLRLVAADSDSRRGPLYFDFETIPDPDRPGLYDDGINRGSCEYPDIFTTVGGTVDAIKNSITGLSHNNETLEYLDNLSAVEQQGKSRSGVIGEIAKLQSAIENSDDELRKILSVTPELCKVAAIGWAVGDGPVHSVLAMGDDEEGIGLGALWRLIAAYSPLVGFNVIHFDLPVLYVRSQILGVVPLKKLDMRPWGNDVVDLMKVRYPAGKATGLKTLAKYYGFEIPAGDMDGSQVAALIESDPQAVLKYVESDVEITRKLHKAYKGTWC